MTAASRTAVLIAATLLVSLVAAATASAGTVTIKNPRGGDDIVVDLQQVAGSFDVDGEYEIRGSSGSARTERIRGISLAKLFEVANADPTYYGVNVLRSNGGSVFISKAQVSASASSPVVYESGGEVRFLRPSTSAADNNADDLVSSAGNLILQQTARADLKIKVKASKTKVSARKPVTFTATVSGIGAGEDYEVSWNFDNGKSGKGDEVSQRYAKRGLYRVLATVKTAGATQSTVVTIQVGNPVKSDKDRTGGGNNDSAGAPDSGASDGASGNGENAATESTPKKQTRKKAAEPASPALPTITGQVIDPNQVAPLEQQSDLAARSGSKTENPEPKKANAGGVPTEAFGVAGALGLLGLGFLLELGAFGGLRSRLTIG